MEISSMKKCEGIMMTSLLTFISTFWNIILVSECCLLKKATFLKLG
ncbi:unnamed protein product [Moneuplotes crassus]|uniref:Uncharacterized protein n=1 Tax=Euplotes crassus TaxID=5936 RepID=A0AAD2D5M8_EUPCR|nr:unnamed protein product [Moneuplotes crassus]